MVQDFATQVPPHVIGSWSRKILSTGRCFIKGWLYNTILLKLNVAKLLNQNKIDKRIQAFGSIIVLALCGKEMFPKCCGQLWVRHMFCCRTCDGLYHFTFFIDPNRSSLPSHRLYSEIDHIHLSSEAQCVSHHLPLVDCRTQYTQKVNIKKKTPVPHILLNGQI